MNKERNFSIICFLVFAIAFFGRVSVLGDEQSKYIYDDEGRVMILRGLNTGDAKWTDTGVSGDSIDFINRQSKDYGFNVVRFLVFWAKIEPHKDVYDKKYLNTVREKVNQYTDNNIKVIIDFHQDLYGPSLSVPPNPKDHNGAPAWATYTDGLVPKEIFLAKYEWSLQNLDPAMLAAQRNFFNYKKNPELQDHLINAQKEVVKLFVNNPDVIGYDLYNEPIGGDIPQMISGTFQENQLSDFYDRAIRSIRGLDQEKYIFVEPQSIGPNQGLAGGLRSLKDYRNGESKLVYAPHIYPLCVTAGKSYNWIDKQQVSNWIYYRNQEIKKLQMPMIVGEIGGPEGKGQSDYLEDILHKLDTMKVGFIWWDNCKGSWGVEDGSGNRLNKTQHLIRPYPKTIAGNPNYYSYKVETGEFELSFSQNKLLDAPTEIFLPKEKYPSGWALEANVADDKWSYIYNEEDQVVSVSFKVTNENIIISVKRK